VRGPATIENTNFSGNSSGRTGGAISSYGSLNITDSQFVRNIAERSGGAIYVRPSDSDTVLMARNSFIENVSGSDGGAIYISGNYYYEGPPVYIILASLFQKNEAVSAGGAIGGTATNLNLVLNTFEDNKSPEGASLDVIHGFLGANVFLGTLSSSSSLCSNSRNPTAFNYSTDISCFSENPEMDPTSTNHLLVRSDKMDLPTALSMSISFQITLPPKDLITSNPTTPDQVALNFLISEIQKDFNSDIRALSVPWTAGHLQLIFPVKPSAPFVSADDTANVIDGLDLTTMEYAIGSSPYSQDPSFDFSGDKTVKVRMKDDGVNGAGWDITLTFTTNPVVPQAPIVNTGTDKVQETPVQQPDNQEAPKPVSIRPTPIVQSDPPVARPEALVSEYSISADELAQIEKRSAALLAAKEARSQARALAAERRRVQLQAFGMKIAATKARGETLKQKSSWINLMKDFQKL